MTSTRFWMVLATATAAAATVLAFGGIWLVTSQPVAVAEAIDGGSITPLVQAVSSVLGQLWGAISRWL